ncbi:MAG: DMT family transporter [Pseudomonadota bacterium]
MPSQPDPERGETDAPPRTAADHSQTLTTAWSRRFALILTFGGVAQPVQATISMLLAMVCFTSMGIFIRFAAEDIHTLEVVFFRNFFALLILLPIVLRSGPGRLKTGNMPLQLVRAGLTIFGMASGFTALTLIPLAEATALGFTAPLFATIGAILILGEGIRIRRMVALAIGFSGVLVVVGPNIGGVSLGAALALTNAVMLALSAIVVKRLTKTDSVDQIITWMVLLSTPLSLIPALFVWTWPAPSTLFWLVCLAGAGTIGHYFWTQACSLAEITQLQPLEFAKLPLMALVGLLIFLEVPDTPVWIGGAIIFASTAYITRREAQLARAARQSRSKPMDTMAS